MLQGVVGADGLMSGDGRRPLMSGDGQGLRAQGGAWRAHPSGRTEADHTGPDTDRWVRMCQGRAEGNAASHRQGSASWTVKNFEKRMKM